MIRAAFIAAIAALLPFSVLAQVNWSSGVVYEYDGSGNVRKIGADTYLYDTAQRLIRGSVAGSQQNYTYDSFGNRKACQPAAGGDCQYGFAIDSATNRVEGRTYDKRGNMLQLPEGNTLEYDELGMVRQENGSGRKVYYIYTADDERIAVYEADTQLSTHKWEWTLRGLDKKPLRELTSEGSSGTASFKWSKDHVWRDGALLASRQADAGAAGGVSTYHYHVDHLGTPRQVTNSASVIIGRHDYLPFGPELTSTTSDEPKLQDLKFTGHERDKFRDRPALDYMHARYYEPRLGRFLSPDPVLGDPERPQTWNRYTYTANNPLSNIDPSGLKTTCVTTPDGERCTVKPDEPEQQPPPDEDSFDTTSFKSFLAFGRAFRTGFFGSTPQSRHSQTQFMQGWDRSADTVWQRFGEFNTPENEFEAAMAILPWGRLAKLSKPIGGVITGFTKHGVNRAIQRGVKPNQILDAVSNPVKQPVTKVDSLGRTSITYHGREATVVVNSAGQVVTVYRRSR